MHYPTHLFYKIRIPIPTLFNPRVVQRPWYPGKPGDYVSALSFEQVKELQKITQSG